MIGLGRASPGLIYRELIVCSRKAKSQGCFGHHYSDEKLTGRGEQAVGVAEDEDRSNLANT